MPVPSWLDHPIHHVVLRSAVALILVICTVNLYFAIMPWLPWSTRDNTIQPELSQRVGSAARPTCRTFQSQAEAQAYYRANPITGKRLDANRDGIACNANRTPLDWTPVPVP